LPESPLREPNGDSGRRTLGHKADFTKSIAEMYEEEKELEMPPPVLVPCYRNKGLNKAQQLLMFMND
jgi:hypothetical protein